MAAIDMLLSSHILDLNVFQLISGRSVKTRVVSSLRSSIVKHLCSSSEHAGNKSYREYHVSVFWYQVKHAKQETTQDWRGLPGLSDVFLVEPDKFDIKRH